MKNTKNRQKKPSFGRGGDQDRRNPRHGKPHDKPRDGYRDKPGRDRQNDRPRREGPRPDRAREPGAKKLNVSLFGAHAVREAWLNPKRHVHALYITEAAQGSFAESMQTGLKRPAPTIVAKEDLDRSLPPGTVHQGIALSCQPLDEISAEDIVIRAASAPSSVLIMLDQVTDPHNVGAILRSACAFGAAGMILQRKHAPEPTGILAKTASGAVEHVPIAYETNLTRALEALQEAGYVAIGMDERGEKTFADLPRHERIVLVMGAEGSGLRRLVREQCDVLVRLSTTGPIQSLNVSAAASVALYALQQ